MSKTPLTPAELAKLDWFRNQIGSGTFYSLLGLDARAGRADVERAYRDYVRDWHPDRFFSRAVGEMSDVIENNFVEVTRAYKTLRDTNKRAVYDADLRQQGVEVAQVGGVARDERVGFEVKVERPAARGARVGAAVDASVGAPPSPASRAPRPAAPPAPARPAAAAEAAPQQVERAPARPSPAVNRLRGQIAEQFGRAKAYFDAGVADLEAGRFSKAESSFYLAMRYDSRNEEYAAYFRRAQLKAKQGRASGFITLGAQAEQFGNQREALVQYRRAVECEPDEGLAYAKLALLLRVVEEDSRESLNLLRIAVRKEPRRPEFRIALAELYVELNMAQNAARELSAALEVDPANEKARALRKQIRGY
jgi:curved DNA-binding protein CbpA